MAGYSQIIPVRGGPFANVGCHLVKRGSGKLVGHIWITRACNGLSERGFPALEVMIQRAVKPGMMD